MSEATLTAESVAPITAKRRVRRTSIAAIAWRNLWRNRRRTWLMAAGIGFAGLLVVAISSIQVGTLDLMVDNTTRFYHGHVQIQHPAFEEEPRIDHTVADAAARLADLSARSAFVAVAPRAQAFALLSVGERSFGGMVVGVDPDREFAGIRHRIDAGRYLESPGEAYMGAVLAKNLGIGVGDEFVVLGNSETGGVAAMALDVVGTFATGQVDFDRSQVHVHLSEFQDAFGLDDEVHVIAGLLADSAAAEEVAAALGDGDAVGLAWQTLLPEVRQLVDMKMQGSYMIYALLVVLVVFSIVNAFIMTTFERLPEFGMLKALGMRPGGILGMMSWEALWMALLGLAVTFGVAGTLLLILAQTGIPLGDTFAEMTSQYLIPNQLYPGFSVRSGIEFSIAILVATQLAALIPTLRMRRMPVVDALRAEE